MAAASDVDQGVADPRAEENRRRILAAAEELIAVHGVEKVRLRDIATQAGVSVGMIQHYFDTRDGVIDAMMGAASVRRVTEWATIAAHVEDPTTKLVTLLEHAVDDRQRCTIWLATTSAASRDERYRQDVEINYRSWRAQLIEVIELGYERDHFAATGVDVIEIVDTILSVIDGLMAAVAMNLDTYTPERNTRMLRRVAGLLLGVDLESSAAHA
nr:TetR/AcrR family transcriptional regulator [Rhodococcus sp. (in: high G+C Gram-positive bacteria)]